MGEVTHAFDLGGDIARLIGRASPAGGAAAPDNDLTRMLIDELADEGVVDACDAVRLLLAHPRALSPRAAGVSTLALCQLLSAEGAAEAALAGRWSALRKVAECDAGGDAVRGNVLALASRWLPERCDVTNRDCTRMIYQNSHCCDWKPPPAVRLLLARHSEADVSDWYLIVAGGAYRGRALELQRALVARLTELWGTRNTRFNKSLMVMAFPTLFLDVGTVVLEEITSEYFTALVDVSEEVSESEECLQYQLLRATNNLLLRGTSNLFPVRPPPPPPSGLLRSVLDWVLPPAPAADVPHVCITRGTSSEFDGLFFTFIIRTRAELSEENRAAIRRHYPLVIFEVGEIVPLPR